ncbi:hypothetical protein [Arthrobacter sp. fls2-241-R2A-200]|uniref:hypothetical protein n=1 Tax=Arthrobacter sp. fls2-241-R2A-200 TaxID=3040281 RepID=UPI00254F50E1|nr:hypothetical protein [Arthrobacter sp. fls2-241-R2A-200]
MEFGETVWMQVLIAAVAWLTVVSLLIARVPKPPSLLDTPDDLDQPGPLDHPEHLDHPGQPVQLTPTAPKTPHDRLRRFLPKPRAVGHPRAKRRQRSEPKK